MSVKTPVIGYVRVSTIDQAQEGVSLAAQRDSIETWAVSNGHQVLQIFEDEGLSGKSMSRRPNLLKALELVKRERGIFVVYSMSRMSRSVIDAITVAVDLQKAGVEFVSRREKIDTTHAMGRAFYAMSAVFGQLERDLIVERTQAAMDHKRSKGEFLGNAPFGWRHESRGEDSAVLVMNETEQRGLQIIREQVATTPPGSRPPYAKIAAAMNAAGIPPRYAFEKITDPNSRKQRKRVPAGPEAKWDRGTARRIVQTVIKKGEQPAAHQTLAA